jgi:PKD domain
MRRLLSTIRRPRELSRRVALRAGGAALVLSCVASLAISTSAAQAIVVNDNGTEAGVALLPSTRGTPLPSGVTAVTATGSCNDPWLSTDLGGPSIHGGLCYRGGGVMHENETFALTWDQPRAYWSQTRGYVEQFLRDVADSSGSLNTPYAVTTQYRDQGGRAQNASVFGGGCIDYGSTGGSACEFGNPTGAGHDYPSNGCTPGGNSFIAMSLIMWNEDCLTDAQLQGELSTMIAQTGILGRTKPGYTPLVTLLLPPGVVACLDASDTLCSANNYLTPPLPSVNAATTGGSLPAGNYRVVVTYDTNQGESAPSGSQSVTTTGTTSSITVDSPPSPPSGPPAHPVTVTGYNIYVDDGNGFGLTLQASNQALGTNVTLQHMQAGGAPPSQPAFCSYHSEVNVGGTEVAYVVQPWTAGTSCDEPDAPTLPNNPTPSEMSIGIGQRLVSPLSQSEIAAIVNPGLNAWAASDGSEIDDAGSQVGIGQPCVPEGNGLDTVTLGSSSQNPYYLQREFNNGAALELDPWTYFGCAPLVDLVPQFVVPSAIDQGDEVELDGSATESTLVVPDQEYSWNFGDGTTATGPSVVHSYSKGGTYTVTLNVTDRGGNTASLVQTITVLGPAGQTPTPPSTKPGGGGGPASALQVRLQLTPQSLKSVLNKGIAVEVRSNRYANGIVTVSISRAEAKRAHIKLGRGSTVVIARGTTAGIQDGNSFLTLRLPRSAAAKLKKLRHATFTIRLSLVAAGGAQMAIDAAGRY